MERKRVQADVGAIVGRFQVDKLHPGHMELIHWVCKEHRKVIVVLGVAKVPGLRENPLDFELRANMLWAVNAGLSKANLTVVPLQDNRYDEVWSKNLDSLIEGLVTPSQSVVLYGSRDSFINRYSGKIKTQELVGDKDIWSGTQVREDLKRSVRNSDDFRAGAIWQAYNTYPRVIPTVDIAIFREDGQKIKLLLVQKPGEVGLRFVGGHADPESDSFEADAIREAEEEVGVKLEALHCIGSVKIDDWRYTGIDKVKTTFFCGKYVSGDCVARDDVDKSFWVDYDSVKAEAFVSEHRPLFSRLVSCSNLFLRRDK